MCLELLQNISSYLAENVFRTAVKYQLIYLAENVFRTAVKYQLIYLAENVFGTAAKYQLIPSRKCV